MRIAHLNQDPGVDPGRTKGAAVHVAALREAFEAEGCGVLAVDEKAHDRALDRLERAHAERPFDLVYERYSLAGHAGLEFAQRTGVPLVLEVNAPLLLEDRDFRAGAITEVQLQRERDVLRGAALVLAVSREVGDYVCGRGVARQRLLVRPNGFDPNHFRPLEPEHRARVREQLGIPAEAFVVGFHGRLRPWHGFDRIAAALSRLADRSERVWTVCVGSGSFADALERAGLRERTVVREWIARERVGEVVACFDALPLGYTPEGPSYFSPLKLFEAMACGVVPVVPPVGDLPLFVSNATNGRLYRAGDASALASSLGDLVADPALCERLGRGARETATAHTWRAIAAEVMGLVAQLARSTALDGAR